MSYQPPYGQPPQYPGQPPWGPPPPKKRHRIRNTFLATAGVFILLIVIVVIAGIAGSSNSGSSRSSSVAAGSASSPSTQASAASAPSSPAPHTPTEVEFVVTGNVPASQFGSVDITYGSDSASHNVTVPSLDGTVTYKVPFDSSAEYYALNVNIDGGSASCQIITTGPGDNPLTVSHGSASGQAECSAQAAPENGGLSWDNEQ